MFWSKLRMAFLINFMFLFPVSSHLVFAIESSTVFDEAGILVQPKYDVSPLGQGVSITLDMPLIANRPLYFNAGELIGPDRITGLVKDQIVCRISYNQNQDSTREPALIGPGELLAVEYQLNIIGDQGGYPRLRNNLEVNLYKTAMSPFENVTLAAFKIAEQDSRLLSQTGEAVDHINGNILWPLPSVDITQSILKSCFKDHLILLAPKVQWPPSLN